MRWVIRLLAGRGRAVTLRVPQAAPRAEMHTQWRMNDSVPPSPPVAFSRRVIVSRLFELVAAKIHRLERPHVGDVLDRVLCEHQQIGRLAFSERAKVLVDAEHL